MPARVKSTEIWRLQVSVSKTLTQIRHFSLSELSAMVSPWELRDTQERQGSKKPDPPARHGNNFGNARLVSPEAFVYYFQHFNTRGPAVSVFDVRSGFGAVTWPRRPARPMAARTFEPPVKDAIPMGPKDSYDTSEVIFLEQKCALEQPWLEQKNVFFGSARLD